MKPLRLALVLTTAAALGGCVVAPLGPYRGGPYAMEPGPVVDAAPPPAPYEAQPVAPGPGYVWIGGYWGWNLGRHVWIGGRWALPPAGYGWVPGYWGRHGQGWRWHGGYWGRR
ncbi:MAG: hypothetical protein U1F56_14640 [Rubrivivax sp.]